MRLSIKIISLIILVYPGIIQAQESENINKYKNLEIGSELALNISPGENIVGTIFNVSKSVYSNKKGYFVLQTGIQEEFQVTFIRGFPGTKGTGYKNGVHLSFGPVFYMLKSKKLSAGFKIFGGWSYQYSNGKIDNEALNINRSYINHNHYFARGLYWQAGYLLKNNVIITGFAKNDIRRITNFDGILEYPEWLYGIGIMKRF
jgi:hypothetical protein